MVRSRKGVFEKRREGWEGRMLSPYFFIVQFMTPQLNKFFLFGDNEG
jgi:hypothetical protein